MVGKENVKVSYWDTVGAERFSSLKQPLFSCDDFSTQMLMLSVFATASMIGRPS
jgi:hypothetical protein